MIPGNILDREFQKFDETSGGETAVRVIVADGSFAITVTDYSDQVLNIFDESLAVLADVPSTILSYVVPVGKKLLLSRVEASGSNISKFSVLVNSVVQAKKRTYFGGELNVNFDFFSSAALGLKLSAGDTLQVEGVHSRPTAGDFESRIVGVLIDE